MGEPTPQRPSVLYYLRTNAAAAAGSSNFLGWDVCNFGVSRGTSLPRGTMSKVEKLPSQARELDRGNRSRYNQENRGCQRARETGDSRSRSHHLSRSVEPGETRIRCHSVVEQHRSILPQSPANQNNAQDSGALLDLLEKHLDPMLHEASIGRSTYTPDTSLPPPASPVFVLSSVAGQDEQAAPPGGTQQAVDAFLAEITTPPPSSSRFSQHWGLNSATPAATR
ncbi:hypothetical protein OsI_16222 [Oryza sativa Indica Group]|uniref:Uncharacterized protein n=1 Tax=Oryza sativa subsp. indica TaxID=39946 RepID=B8AV33_ORYSI|nr:hypothetical protein OsI_16222 [Oryza sativa Indica Group]